MASGDPDLASLPPEVRAALAETQAAADRIERLSENNRRYGFGPGDAVRRTRWLGAETDFQSLDVRLSSRWPKDRLDALYAGIARFADPVAEEVRERLTAWGCGPGEVSISIELLLRAAPGAPVVAVGATQSWPGYDPFAERLKADAENARAVGFDRMVVFDYVYTVGGAVLGVFHTNAGLYFSQRSGVSDADPTRLCGVRVIAYPSRLERIQDAGDVRR